MLGLFDINFFQYRNIGKKISRYSILSSWRHSLLDLYCFPPRRGSPQIWVVFDVRSWYLPLTVSGATQAFFSCHEELKKYSKSLKFFLSKTVHYYCELRRRNSFWSDETSMITMHVRCRRKVTSRRIELENASSEKSQLQEPSNQKIRYASHGYRYTSRPIRMSVTPVHVAVAGRSPEGPAQRVVVLLINLSTVM